MGYFLHKIFDFPPDLIYNFVHSVTYIGRLAQLVEHQSYKLVVVGSNPTPPTSLRSCGTSSGWRHSSKGKPKYKLNKS